MTMTNYLDHLNPVSIDPAFQAGLNWGARPDSIDVG